MPNNRKATSGRKFIMRPDQSKNKARAFTQNRLLNNQPPAKLCKIVADILPPEKLSS